jgi:transcriptional regulator with XRE-family HTH domain
MNYVGGLPTKEGEAMAGLKLYKSYSFKTKDPVIDQVRTMIQDKGTKYKKIEADSGVSATTVSNWLTGPTLRPQHATVMAVIRALGYDMVFVDQFGQRMGNVPAMARSVSRRPRSRSAAAKLPKARAALRNGHAAAY